jgi:hypothetical protein
MAAIPAAMAAGRRREDGVFIQVPFDGPFGVSGLCGRGVLIVRSRGIPEHSDNLRINCQNRQSY